MPDEVQTTLINESATKPKLAATLLAHVLMFSFFVTLATSAYIIYSDYLQGANKLNESITQIKAGYQESISYSLWNFDSQQIKTQLAGILNFPGILNVYIKTKEGLLHSAGDFEQNASQKHAFDLFFTSAERQYPLGVLNITLDYKGLYETLFYKALNILATQFVKTFSVSLFILFIFQRLVTHRLRSMYHWAKDFSINDLDKKLIVHASHRKSGPDEIDAVVNSINSMRNSLREDIKKRESTENKLNQTQHKLSIAINNAELGFCEYSQKHDQLLGNEHFSSHLEISPSSLEQLEHPIDWFKSIIVGDRSIEQRERINQLLHGHMERICTELSLRCGNEKIKHFDTTIQVSEWDDNGLPLAIVFCILDKTEQVNASKQAADLNFALEQKVIKRTEELSNEQVQSKAEIKKLQRYLSSLELQKQRQQSQQSQKPLKHALKKVKDLIHTNSENEYQQAVHLVDLLMNHLETSRQKDSQTFDVVHLIKETLSSPLTGVNYKDTHLRLPFSLMLDSYEKVLGYCFERAITTIHGFIGNDFQSKNLTIGLDLEEDCGIITIQYNEPLGSALYTHWLEPISNNMILLKMCDAVLEDSFEGKITVKENEDKIVCIQLHFSINTHN